MESPYIRELIATLEQTQIWRGGSLPARCESYEEGIKLLLEVFTEHIRKNSNLFFLGNG